DPVVLGKDADERVVAAKGRARVGRRQEADKDLALAAVDQPRDSRERGHSGGDLVLLDGGDEGVAGAHSHVLRLGRVEPRGAEDSLRQNVRPGTDVGDAQVLAPKVLDRRDVGQRCIDNLRLTRRDTELADGFDLLAQRVEDHGVHVRTRACIDVAGDDLFLRSLARALVDKSDIQVLGFEIAELLGQHVRQGDLLVEASNHYLYRRETTAGRAGGACTATG